MLEDRIRPLGIDLGTTFSGIAQLGRGNKPEIIRCYGNEITPSVILFEDKSNIVVGDAALRQARIARNNVADFVKRDMGAPDPIIREFHGEEYTAEVLSAIILKKLKQGAETALGGAVDKVVITVPAHFNDAARSATRAAGQIAGFEVLDTINEPMAAALAFGLDKLGTDQIFCVYDLGGGTFDVTIMRIEGNKIEEIAKGGEPKLGGKEWDDEIIKYVASDFMKKHGKDPLSDNVARQEIAMEAEKAKRDLGQLDSVRIFCSFEGKSHSVELSRGKFEELTKELLKRTEFMTRVVLKNSGLTWGEIDRVLLVGGSTHMPMVPKMIEKLSGKRPDASVPAELVVAYGAAVHAAIREEKFVKGPIAPVDDPTPVMAAADIRDIEIKRTSSFGLGILARDPKTGKDNNVIVVPKDEPLPCEVTKEFEAIRDGMQELQIHILEGDTANIDGCSKVGSWPLTVPGGSQKGVRVKVTLGYGEDNIVNVHAVYAKTGDEVTGTLRRHAALSEEEIKEHRKKLEAKTIK